MGVGGGVKGKLSTSPQYSVGPLDGTGRLARRSGGQDDGTDRAITAAGTVETRGFLLSSPRLRGCAAEKAKEL